MRKKSVQQKSINGKEKVSRLFTWKLINFIRLSLRGKQYRKCAVSVISIEISLSVWLIASQLFCYFLGKGSELRKSVCRKSKRTSKIWNGSERRTVSIKRIRTLKDQNDDNYLWSSTYGYQGLWGVMLGSVRLGLVRIG